MDFNNFDELSEKLKTLTGLMENSNLGNISDEDMMGIFDEEMKSLNEDFENYKPKLYLGFKVLHPDAVLPKYNYGGDSGFDLHSVEEITIEPFGRALVPTGISLDIKDGYEIQVRSKSGLALKEGLFVLNSPGTVDASYSGEIKVIIFNTNQQPYTIKKGMKVAQAVLCPVVNGSWVNLEEVTEISDKERGENGFGSTNLF
jgi:dUTP pyrophosphatase